MDPAEYERRRQFCEALRSLSRAEHIQIARILRKNGVPMSENRSGLFFDMAKVDQTVVDELQQFQSFVHKNEAELARRVLPSNASLKAPAR